MYLPYLNNFKIEILTSQLTTLLSFEQLGPAGFLSSCFTRHYFQEKFVNSQKNQKILTNDPQGLMRH